MNATEFLTKLKSLSKEQLQSIKGIGDILAKNYEDFLYSNRYKHLIEEFGKLEQNGVKLNIQRIEKRDTSKLKLSKEIICITGVFNISRNEIKTQLENLGAKVVDSVTSNTSILLAGDKAGSKLEKAKKLDIKIIRNLTELL